jgi:hypothetical protein
MTVARVRHDVYGAPLPTLTDAAQQSRASHGHNPEIYRDALRLLDTLLTRIMVRGCHGRLTLEFMVQDGKLQAEIRHSFSQTYHCVTED